MPAPTLGTLGTLEIDLARDSVRKNGASVTLTQKGWALLRVMATRPERIHTRELLQHALYGFDDDTGSNTLEVFISRLRRKLGHVRHNAERANDSLALSIVGAIMQKHRALLALSHASCCGPRPGA